jgi:hypothetical protein
MCYVQTLATTCQRPQEVYSKVALLSFPATTVAENLQELWPWDHDDVDKFRHYRGP